MSIRAPQNWDDKGQVYTTRADTRCCLDKKKKKYDSSTDHRYIVVTASLSVCLLVYVWTSLDASQLPDFSFFTKTLQGCFQVGVAFIGLQKHTHTHTADYYGYILLPIFFWSNPSAMTPPL